MNLQKRLIVSFFTMIFMPIFLAGVAFFGLTKYYTSILESKYQINASEYEVFGNSIQLPDQYSKSMYRELTDTAAKTPSKLTDEAFLSEKNSEIWEYNSYIIVRDGNQIIYNGNNGPIDNILSYLPEFSLGTPSGDTALYISDGRDLLVRQLDFSNEKTERGSLFLVTKAQQFSTEFKDLGFQVVLSIILILMITSLSLTWWIYKGIITPLKKLQYATQSIKEGNLDFTLDYESNDEIGELFNNFEEMRVRLKTSTTEKLESDKENKELISNISHDLKTPITAVKGYVEGIMDGVADTPEKMDKYIKTIYNKANEMDSLINELTLYCKIDTNRIPYNFNKINVCDYFEDCVEELSFDLESKNIDLVYNNNVERTVQVIADSEQLARVLHNIIGNSAKYIDKIKGLIQIRIKDVGDFVQVEIEDNGKGIAQKDIQYIFDRFYRTDASRNSSQGGSGIGLSIVKKIIEDHGGKIWASSKEGIGTTMYFVLRKYQEVQIDE